MVVCGGGVIARDGCIAVWHVVSIAVQVVRSWESPVLNPLSNMTRPALRVGMLFSQVVDVRSSQVHFRELEAITEHVPGRARAYE